jgi:16S rRNA (guanine966-N2)-methyltransferase
MPRVISGKYRGIHLETLKGDLTRPTTDKVKEALFSIIQNKIPDAIFLDLFSGSGQIGIEAISRGAEEVFLVEQNPKAISVMRANIEKTRITSGISVIKTDVFRALSDLSVAGKKFDIIFMDPPYAEAIAFVRRVGKLISDNGLLNQGGIFVCEHSACDNIDENVMNLTFSRRCKYGTTMLTFYNRYNDSEGIRPK